MRYLLLSLLSLLITFFSCDADQTPTAPEEIAQPQQHDTEHFVLLQPAGSINGLLVLFGGYPEQPEDIQREFGISELAQANGIAVLYMKFNQRLWLEAAETEALTDILENGVKQFQLPVDYVYLGGFSSGGNVALLLANHLVAQNSIIQPEGVFIVDSPVDLLALYRCSEKNVARNFSAGSVQESQRTIATLDNYFGPPTEGIERYAQHSPYLAQTNDISNLCALEDIKIRLYTEPDTIWWQVNRQNAYEDLNAYAIKQLAETLATTFGADRIELIETQGKGIRANGHRHPHSWSIVDKEGLLAWMMEATK